MAKKKTSKRKASDRKMTDALDKHFQEEYNEVISIEGENGEHQLIRFGNESIEKQDAGDAVMNDMKVFGANKNLYRVIPNLISGMKPGKVRLYYAWWEMEGCPQNTKKETLNKLKFYKVEIISSRSELYHPHGTASMQEIIGKDGQYWSNNVMLIVPKGSYGNARGRIWSIAS